MVMVKGGRRVSGGDEDLREVNVSKPTVHSAAAIPTALEQALSRARGLARQNRDLKRSIHQLHVSLQNEIDNRIKGESLRQKVRELEVELAAVRKAEKEWHADEERLRGELQERLTKAEHDRDGWNNIANKESADKKKAEAAGAKKV